MSQDNKKSISFKWGNLKGEKLDQPTPNVSQPTLPEAPPTRRSGPISGVLCAAWTVDLGATICVGMGTM